MTKKELEAKIKELKRELKISIAWRNTWKGTATLLQKILCENMTKPKIKIVHTGNWEAMYVNGKLVAENHSLNTREILFALKLDYELLQADDEWMEDVGDFPENFKDVKAS